VTGNVPMIESISAITLATHDMARAVGFYRKLGFELVYGDNNAAFTTFRVGPNYLNLIAQPHQRHWWWWGRVIFYVADVDGFYAHVIAAGLKPETTPRDAEWGERFFHLVDPDGHELSFARQLGLGNRYCALQARGPGAMVNTRVTVFGGSGFIGRHLATELVARGATVRIGARHAGHASDRRIEVVAADVLDDSSVASAVVGASAVINLVGILSETGHQTYAAVHVGGARRVALAARSAGALRLIHFSALGATKVAPALSDRTKAEGEEAVRAAFPAATIIRPSLVFGSDDHFFTRFAKMAQRSPVLPLIGGGATKFQPAHVEDVAAAVVDVLMHGDTAGRAYEFGGPEIYSLKELLELMLAALGWRRLLLPVPFALAETFAGMLDLLPASVLTRDQVRLLQTDKINSGREATFAELGIWPTDQRTFLVGAFKARYS